MGNCCEKLNRIVWSVFDFDTQKRRLRYKKERNTKMVIRSRYDIAEEPPNMSSPVSVVDVWESSRASSSYPNCDCDTSLSSLVAAVAEAYDDQKHQHLLRSLWRAMSLEDSTYCRCSWRWLYLGFQGDNPTNDLRGIGAFGLQQLVHFVQRGGGLVVLRENDAHAVPFPLAAASFNVTHMLTGFLRLSNAPTPGPRCSDATFCLITRLAVSCPQILDLIHTEITRALADRWFRMQSTQSTCGMSRKMTIMHFPFAREVIDARTREALTLAAVRGAHTYCGRERMPDLLRFLRQHVRDPVREPGKLTYACSHAARAMASVLTRAVAPIANAHA